MDRTLLKTVINSLVAVVDHEVKASANQYDDILWGGLKVTIFSDAMIDMAFDKLGIKSLPKGGLDKAQLREIVGTIVATVDVSVGLIPVPLVGLAWKLIRTTILSDKVLDKLFVALQAKGVTGALPA